MASDLLKKVSVVKDNVEVTISVKNVHLQVFFNTILQSEGQWTKMVRRYCDKMYPNLLLVDIKCGNFFSNVDENYELISKCIKKCIERFEASIPAYLLKQYEGFDENSGLTWIYITPEPIREYPQELVCGALFKNTLIVMPNYKEKSLIAVLVMYNITRWYPKNQVLFMTISEELVSHYLEEVNEIIGIFKNQVNITVGQRKEERMAAWRKKQFWFTTPETVYLDIEDPDFPVKNIKLVIIDESLLDKVKHSYCDIVRIISSKYQWFRILAFTSSRAETTEEMARMVRNLLISQIRVVKENGEEIDTTNEVSLNDLMSNVLTTPERLIPWNYIPKCNYGNLKKIYKNCLV